MFIFTFKFLFMTYCLQIKELVNVIVKSDNLEEQLSAKSKLLDVCKFMPLDENHKSVMILNYSGDIDRFIFSKNKDMMLDTMELLKDALFRQFDCYKPRT